LSEIATSITKRDPKSFASTPVQEMSSEPISEVKRTPATLAASYKIIKVTDVQKKNIYHKVHKGENLTEIAKKYSVSLKDLKEWNDLNANSNLFVGKKLKIEQTETSC
jgi:LysM repeat protein